jgi:acetyl esterase/lipase
LVWRQFHVHHRLPATGTYAEEVSRRVDHQRWLGRLLFGLTESDGFSYMNSRHLLDPQVAAAVDQLPRLPQAQENLHSRRAAYAQLMDALLPLLPAIPGIDASEHHAPGNAGEPPVRLLVYRPQQPAQTLPALLWIHGGGYVDGRADWDEYLAKALVRDVGCCVVSVDYRLAPETAFPGAVEDCHAALCWLQASAREMHIDPHRIGVAGVSAGGGLAAALALLARDRGGPALCFQALLQPMLDDRSALEESRHPFAGEFIWTRENNHFGWSALLGHAPGEAGTSPYAAAARADSLRDLPATFISVGALDLFVEENIEYARRLIQEGVPTELHVHPGACHAFQFLAPTCPAAQLHEHNLIAALRLALGTVDDSRGNNKT